MKTIHLLLSAAVGLFLLPSCVCNTSGKLDTVGKTQTVWRIAERTHIYNQNGKYYVKGEACICDTSAKAFTYLWKSKTEPDLAHTKRTEEPSHRGYHQITIPENDSIPLRQAQITSKRTVNAPISFTLTPDTPWIPAATFAHTPFRAIDIHHQNPPSFSFDQVDNAETHRTNGNILRTPLVAVLFVAVDIPGSIVATIGGTVAYAIQETSK